MINIIQNFLGEIASNRIEVYNEFSLQFELGIYLRSRGLNKKIQFERNVSRYGYPGSFTKREIDLAMEPLNEGPKLDCAIELKFPRNGQVPEQMFKFCEDLAFLEELKRAGCKDAYLLALADNAQFWSGRNLNGIYSYFRGGQMLTGQIGKPTGAKNKRVVLWQSYPIRWVGLTTKFSYLLIQV